MILEFPSLIITAPNGEEQDNALKALWADGSLWFQEKGGLWLEFQKIYTYGTVFSTWDFRLASTLNSLSCLGSDQQNFPTCSGGEIY